mmetsp:Transcript_97110/g.192429  ORF Transcript_97110/g.192429 Transcript_97110/m.192429 type:complete len:746 (-) Transcript_97110:64-2301(-)
MRSSAAPLAPQPVAPLLALGLAVASAGNWYDGLTNVYVLRPEDDNQPLVDSIFAAQENAHFDSSRVALLLLPGSHKESFHIHVGYYTSVIGVGRTPENVQLGRVLSSNGANGHATNNFWRSLEGVTLRDEDIVWAVSQASPIRRSVINGNLFLSDRFKYASGGFMADVTIHGQLNMGTQQQWFFRNVDLLGGIECPTGWNYVFVGQRGLDEAAQRKCAGETPGKVVSVPQPFSAEKPFLVFDNNAWFIHVPRFVGNISGAAASLVDLRLALEDVFITRPNMSAAEINAGIRGKRGLLVTPAIYELTDPVEITQHNFVVLGIGFPTLIATQGRPALQVANGLTEVRVAGLLLEAGTVMRPDATEPLLRWGTKVNKEYTFPGKPAGLLSDVFARVGSFHYRGCPIVRADRMVQIDSDDVVLDHLWLWHADHDDCGTELKVVGLSDNCFSEHGLLVNGRRVTSLGLASEHTTMGHMVMWNGEEGQVYFFQAEAPYHQPDWGARGFAGYAVAPEVEQHKAYGIGVYVIAAQMKQTVRCAFLLPAYAEVYHLFNVTILGNNQFASLACVQDSDSCYQPEVCEPMRCYSKAFPRRDLPPDRASALHLQQVLAAKKLAERLLPPTTTVLAPSQSTTRLRTGASGQPQQVHDRPESSGGVSDSGEGFGSSLFAWLWVLPVLCLLVLFVSLVAHVFRPQVKSSLQQPVHAVPNLPDAESDEEQDEESFHHDVEDDTHSMGREGTSSSLLHDDSR